MGFCCPYLAGAGVHHALQRGHAGIGRGLSDAGVGTGYQDAVTPPWESNLGLLTYALMIVAVAAAWYEFGVGRAIGTLLALFGATLVWRRILPNEGSNHYRKLIVASMARRYASWVRSGDSVRAATMAELLRKLRIDLPGGATPVSNETGPTKGQAIGLLVNAYGAALEVHAASGSIVSDVSLLPAPKDTLRAALIASIHASEDATYRDHLQGAYIMLASFQEGVGSRVIAIDTDLSAVGGDLKEAAARISAQSDEFIGWATKVTTEQARLQEDLRGLEAARTSRPATQSA